MGGATTPRDARAAAGDAPRVSVLMAAYNAERFIAESIDSVVRQTYEDWELIVLDDGSTDRTAEIAKSYADRRIRCFANERNMGLVYTRNRLVSLAAGAYLAVLDSDDVAYPERLEREARFLDEHPEHGLVGGGIDFIDAEGRHIGERWSPCSVDSDIPASLFFGNQFAHSTVLMRRSVLPEPAYRIGYAPAEDYDLWVRLAQSCRVHNIATSLVAYRRHGSNVSFAANSGLALAERKILRDNVRTMTGTDISEHDAGLLHQLFRRAWERPPSRADAERLSTLLAALAAGFPGGWANMKRATFVRLTLQYVLELQEFRARGPLHGLLATLRVSIGSPVERASFVSGAFAAGLRRRLAERS